MQDRIKLPLSFEPELLKEDLEKLKQIEWIGHFVKQNYEGGWDIIPLRGPKGAQHPVMMIYSDPNCEDFEDTPFLDYSPYFKKVLDEFKCKLESVRLMKLAAGSKIKEHKDYDLCFEDGTIRIHIPIITNNEVYFFLNGKRIIMKEGECWYLKLSENHSVENKSNEDRVHLVIDAKVNEWVKDIFNQVHV